MSVAGLMALPTVLDDFDLEDVGNEQNLPDISRNEAIWIVLFAASEADDSDVALDRLRYVALPFAPASMDAEETIDHIRAAARGEYDVEALEYRAAYVWNLHRTRGE